MNMSTTPVCFGVLLILLGSNLPVRAQGNLQMNGFLPQQSTASAPEDAPYTDGTNYLNEGQWGAAAGKFGQVAALHGKRADSALSWKAYALHKRGRRQDALATLAVLRQQ